MAGRVKVDYEANLIKCSSDAAYLNFTNAISWASQTGHSKVRLS